MGRYLCKKCKSEVVLTTIKSYSINKNRNKRYKLDDNTCYICMNGECDNGYRFSDYLEEIADWVK